MKFLSYGEKQNPTIILLHGGGLDSWSLSRIVKKLQNKYHIVTPTIEGHGIDDKDTFSTIEDSASHLLEYIDKEHHGEIFMLGGLSLGAQIAVEAISLREKISQYAVIESALVCPINMTVKLTTKMVRFSYKLISYKWFARVQAKALYVPDEFFEKHYDHSRAISKESLCNITVSNGTYDLKEGLKNTRTKTLIIVGAKEIPIMIKSAKKLHNLFQKTSSTLSPNFITGN